jgi:hypothetical protein
MFVLRYDVVTIGPATSARVDAATNASVVASRSVSDWWAFVCA